MSNASRFPISAFPIVHVSKPYSVTLHMTFFSIRYGQLQLIFPLRSFLRLLKNIFANCYSLFNISMPFADTCNYYFSQVTAVKNLFKLCTVNDNSHSFSSISVNLLQVHSIGIERLTVRRRCEKY